MPNSYGDLLLYLDNSNKCVGGALFQVINGEERLIAYHSKVMPPSFKRLTLSEKGLMALLVAITHFKYILRGAHFYAFVDYSALVQIMKSKTEIPTLRMKKMYERQSSYSYVVCCGRDLVVADCLSRSPPIHGLEDSNEITPISFNTIDADTAVALSKTLEDFRGDTKVTDYAFPITRSVAQKQNILIPTF